MLTKQEYDQLRIAIEAMKISEWEYTSNYAKISNVLNLLEKYVEKDKEENESKNLIKKIKNFFENPDKDIRLRLIEEDLRCLFRGEVLTIKTHNGTASMILTDIGFDRIQAILSDAMSGNNTYKGFNRKVD